MDESVDKEAVAAPEPDLLPGEAEARAERLQPLPVDHEDVDREARGWMPARPDMAEPQHADLDEADPHGADERQAAEHLVDLPEDLRETGTSVHTPEITQDLPEEPGAAPVAAPEAPVTAIETSSSAPDPSAAVEPLQLEAADAAKPEQAEAPSPASVIRSASPPFLPPSARIPVIEPSTPIAPGSRPGIPTEGESGPTLPTADAADPTLGPFVPGALLRPPGALRRIPEAVTAQIIPFVPRNGIVRSEAAAELPPPVTAEPPFARQPVPYFVSPAEGLAPRFPQPAIPPPPSGFRRPADWSRQPVEPAAELPASQPEPVAPKARAGLALPTSFTWPSWLTRPASPMKASALASIPWPKGRSWREGWSIRRVVKGALQAIALLLIAYATLIAVLVVAYRWIDPPMSALMLGQRLSGTELSQRWVPLDRISPNLQQAVILSEDGRFCQHHGVDWGELKEAIEQSLDGWGARGGSTISMQTAKNLFLWPSKSYVRKGIEIPLAMGTEMVWPKARMLEIYLNIAEWGPGIFGAEAAARYHFGKPASALTAREASLLAVSLPNPFDRQAGRPGPGTQRLADNLQVRMRRVPNAASCGRTQRVRGAPGVADSRWP